MTEILKIYMVDGNVVEMPGDVETMAKVSDLMESGKGTVMYKTGKGPGGFISPRYIVRVELVEEPAKASATDTLTVMRAANDALKRRSK